MVAPERTWVNDGGVDELEVWDSGREGAKTVVQPRRARQNDVLGILLRSQTQGQWMDYGKKWCGGTDDPELICISLAHGLCVLTDDRALRV